jgi:hypothetical protein
MKSIRLSVLFLLLNSFIYAETYQGFPPLKGYIADGVVGGVPLDTGNIGGWCMWNSKCGNVDAIWISGDFGSVYDPDAGEGPYYKGTEFVFSNAGGFSSASGEWCIHNQLHLRVKGRQMGILGYTRYEYTEDSCKPGLDGVTVYYSANGSPICENEDGTHNSNATDCLTVNYTWH